jgi:hypothetical protein
MPASAAGAYVWSGGCLEVTHLWPLPLGVKVAARTRQTSVEAASMGFLDKLRGIERPDEGVAPVGAEDLRGQIIGMDRDELPYSVAPGPGGEEGDIVVEWKIVDARWTGWFAEHGLDKAHRLLLTFNPKDSEVRCMEESLDVEWRAGVPSISASAEAFRGRTLGKKSFGVAIDPAVAASGEDSEIYRYTFDVSEMKDPIVKIVTGNGWAFRPVTTKSGLVDD